MITQAQFVAFLTTRNRFIYFGAPTFGRTQSSMIPVVNAVAAFGAAGTGANLLALIQVIGNLSVASKLKYANALTQLYNSFPNPVYITVNPFALSIAAVAGIGVVRSPNVASHQTDAVLALQQLHGFGTGNTLLQDICNEVNAAHRISVADAVGTFSGGNECQIVNGMPDDYQTDIAAALIGNHAAVGGCIGLAMTAMGHPPGAAGGASFAWLETQINNTPVYQLQGAPNMVPSSTTYGANWISQATLQDWVNGVNAFPAGLPPLQVNAAMLVIGLVLNAGATRSGGGHTRVRWNASNLTSAGLPRPPYIGLGHELIHAWHNMRGEQPGSENGTTTPLYEYLCVGLGPFAALANNTENALRGGAGVALRPYYAP